MIDALAEFQTNLITACRANAGLQTALGSDQIFDAAPKGATPPFVDIHRFDATPVLGQNLKLVRVEIEWLIWLPKAHRVATLAIAAALGRAFADATNGANYKIIHTQNERVQSRIERRSGWTRISLISRFSLEDQTT